MTWGISGDWWQALVPAPLRSPSTHPDSSGPVPRGRGVQISSDCPEAIWPQGGLGEDGDRVWSWEAPPSPSGHGPPSDPGGSQQASWEHLGECVLRQSCWQSLLVQLTPEAAWGGEPHVRGLEESHKACYLPLVQYPPGIAVPRIHVRLQERSGRVSWAGEQRTEAALALLSRDVPMCVSMSRVCMESAWICELGRGFRCLCMCLRPAACQCLHVCDIPSG